MPERVFKIPEKTPPISFQCICPINDKPAHQFIYAAIFAITFDICKTRASESNSSNFRHGRIR